MTRTELLQLIVCLLFPLGLLALFLWNIGTQRGRTSRQIAAHLAVVVTCVAGVVAVGWGLNASRSGPIVSYEAGALGFGSVRAVDVAGLALCAVLLGVTLWAARRVSRSPERDGEAEA